MFGFFGVLLKCWVIFERVKYLIKIVFFVSWFFGICENCISMIFICVIFNRKMNFIVSILEGRFYRMFEVLVIKFVVLFIKKSLFFYGLKGF